MFSACLADGRFNATAIPSESGYVRLLRHDMSAKIVWTATQEAFPASGSVRQRLGHVLKCAVMATGMEDWQPWEYRLSEGHIELRAKVSPELEDVDPEGRELMIRCGVALFHLKLAMKRFGCLGRVELFPDLDHPELIAMIHLGQGHNRNAQEIALFESMTWDPDAFARTGEPPISEAILVTLRSAVADEKALLEFSQSESSRERLLKLTQSGADHNHLKVVSPRGLFRNTRIVRWTLPLLTFASPIAGPVAPEFKAPDGQADRMAAIAVLKTKTDDKNGWLAAGQARARVRLQARISDVSSYVFDRAFRSRHVRDQLRTAVGHKGFAQAVMGFGSYAAEWDFTSPVQQPVTATAS